MHHATLLVGDKRAAEAYLEELCGSPAGSPDYFPSRAELFGIDEARTLSEQASRKAFGSRKIFFLVPEKITLEAQNALLKTFEEPIADTHFFLAVRDVGVIIPTLRSRMQVVRVAPSETHAEAEKFLKLPLKDRLAFVKKFVDREESLSPFLDEILAALRVRSAALPALDLVYKFRLVSDQRAASPRLILEHLATVL